MDEWNSIAIIADCNVFPPLNTWVEVKHENDTPFIAKLEAPQGDWSDYHWRLKLPDSQKELAPLETFTEWRQIDG